MLSAGIVITGLSSTALWVDSFVVECYSNSGLTTLVDKQSVQAIFDSGSGKYVQKDLIGFVGLLPSTQYWFRAGSVAPKSGVTSWGSTFTETTGTGTSVANVAQLQSLSYGTDTGTANAYAVTLSPAPTLTAGLRISFVAANSNTGASTLSVNGGTAKNITKNGTVALVAGDITAGQFVSVSYDGAQFQMTVPSAGGGGSTLARSTVSKTTASLADGASETGTLTIGKSFRVIGVSVDRASRVQLYSTAAARTADANRGTRRPPQGTLHGVIVDLAMNPVLAWPMSPAAPGSNMESSPSSSISYRITNNSGATSTVTVTFTVIVLE